jgi:hypothetical protein
MSINSFSSTLLPMCSPLLPSSHLFIPPTTTCAHPTHTFTYPTYIYSSSFHPSTYLPLLSLHPFLSQANLDLIDYTSVHLLTNQFTYSTYSLSISQILWKWSGEDSFVSLTLSARRHRGMGILVEGDTAHGAQSTRVSFSGSGSPPLQTDGVVKVKAAASLSCPCLLLPGFRMSFFFFLLNLNCPLL